MAETMLALGELRFSIESAAYQELSRQYKFRWATQQRVAARPIKQFVGVGDESITLQGVIYPHYRGGLHQVNQMRDIAANGEPLLLTDGLGFVLGKWVILSISEEQRYFLTNGVPQKISFTLSLAHYGEEQS